MSGPVAPAKPYHVGVCSESINKIEAIETEITEKLDDVKSKRGKLYIGNTLKTGMAEQDKYLKDV